MFIMLSFDSTLKGLQSSRFNNSSRLHRYKCVKHFSSDTFINFLAMVSLVLALACSDDYAFFNKHQMQFRWDFWVFFSK